MTDIEIALIVVGFICFIESLVLLRLRKILGKTFDSALQVITRRIKNPGTFFVFHNNRLATVEFRDTNKTHYLVDEDTNSPVQVLDKTSVYRTYENFPTYVMFQGQISTVDPLKYVVSFMELERLGHIFNKALAAEERRLAQKYQHTYLKKLDDIYKLVIICIILIAVTAFLVYGITEFTKAAQTTFDSYKPALESAINNLPRIEPG